MGRTHLVAGSLLAATSAFAAWVLVTATATPRPGGLDGAAEGPCAFAALAEPAPDSERPADATLKADPRAFPEEPFPPGAVRRRIGEAEWRRAVVRIVRSGREGADPAPAPSRPGPPIGPPPPPPRVVRRPPPPLDLDETRRLLERGTEDEQRKAFRRLEKADDARWEPLIQDALGYGPTTETALALLALVAEWKDPGRGWSAKQATGRPDTPLHGDFATAWAPLREDMGEVTLDLLYGTAVRVESVLLHETLNPGAVARILAFTPEGTWDVVWEGRGAPAQTPVWFAPPVRATDYVTSRIRVVLDTDRVPGWNEIDAVELVGDERRQWAIGAEASSSFADDEPAAEGEAAQGS